MKRFAGMDEHGSAGRLKALPPPLYPAPGIGAGPRNGASPALTFLIQETRRELAASRRPSDESLSSRELLEALGSTATRLGLDLSSLERDEVLAHLEREQKPFGILQELVDNPEISDIIVSDYSRVAVQCGRRTFSTSVQFSDQQAYENFVERLLQRAESTYSTKKPIADGMIGSFARIHAVHKGLCDTGPYLTIRLNRMSAVTIADLIEAGLAPRELFDYLQAIVRSGFTVFVVGEVGTGKTTLVRALASVLPPQDSILVIEDTPEIRLEHPHVRYITTRESNTDGAGRIAPSQCIRAGMRMAMNRIIFGEIRDAEAAEAFVDVCASGHPGISTIHGRSASESLTRLELFLGRAQRGSARQVIADQITTAVQVIVFLNICRETGRRRIIEVKEIGPVADGAIRQREIFRYQIESSVPSWRVSNRVSAYRDTIERGESPCVLSALPASITLGERQLYSEAQTHRRRGG